MSNLVVFAEEKNAAAFKDLFEQTVAEKVMAALAERKKHVAEKLSAEISKQIHHNPAADNKSDLQKDVRGLLTIDASKKASHKGGFTNEKPLAKVWLKPHIPAGQSKLPFTKETAKGK